MSEKNREHINYQYKEGKQRHHYRSYSYEKDNKGIEHIVSVLTLGNFNGIITGKAETSRASSRHTRAKQTE